MKDSPLSDLRFFRFPDLTSEIVRNIVLLVFLLVLTVLLTVLTQKQVMKWSRNRNRRRSFARFSSDHRMEKSLRDLLSRLCGESSASDDFELIADAEAYEQAVAALVEKAGEEELELLARLRRRFHLNVMNPDLALVSTRQLLQDLPVRLIATIHEERLDLYCCLLDVNEEHLFIDLPYQEDIFDLLRENPSVYLLYWREREGETVFRIHLETIEGGTFPVFRARHAFLDEDSAQRSAFRLSADLTVQYRFMERGELFRRRGRKAGNTSVLEEEGRLVDLSYGGASMITSQPLDERGFAQLNFNWHGQDLRLMLEVLSRTHTGDGRYLVRGQFRGMGEEIRVRLNKILAREQIKRLREKEILHIKPAD